MNRETVRTLFAHELRMLLRDRRTVVLSIILPLAVLPVILFASRIMEKRREKRLEETTYRYALAGTNREEVRALIERARKGLQEDGSKPEGLAGFRFEEKVVPDPRAALEAREIHYYLEALSGAEGDAQPPSPPSDEERLGPAAKRPARTPLASDPKRVAGVPVVRILFYADRDESRAGRTRMRELLGYARRLGREQLLRDGGFTVPPSKVLATEDASVASASQVTGLLVGRLATLLVLMLMLTGGSVVSMDIVAGEKERGSLETLLTTAARRGEIVAAKQLAIAAVAATITLIQAANILVYLTLRLVDLPADFVIDVPPPALGALLLLFLPVAALVAALLLMISAYAKSYKEAQLYFFPVYLLSLAPAAASFLPGISLRSAIVAVPIANVSVAVREIFVGKLDWPMILASFCVMCAAAAWAIRASARMLSMERLITASETDQADLTGGPALFPRRVLRWYGLGAVLLFTLAANVPAMANMRIQVLVNQLVLLLGGTFLLIWKYRLRVREALALRPVKPAAWLAVLCAIPSANIVAIGVFRLANYIIPVPQRMLEQFGRDLMPQDVPTWQLFLLLALLPGICEEIAFRGALLYGLHRRLNPVPLALTVGLLFGLFHIALFRIVPTGFLGVVLTAVALLTGSIFPCMLFHAGNNAFGIWAANTGLPLASLEPQVYLSALAVFLLSFYILWRVRTPYPGLREPHRPRK